MHSNFTPVVERVEIVEVYCSGDDFEYVFRNSSRKGGATTGLRIEADINVMRAKISEVIDGCISSLNVLQHFEDSAGEL